MAGDRIALTPRFHPSDRTTTAAVSRGADQRSFEEDVRLTYDATVRVLEQMASVN